MEKNNAIVTMSYVTKDDKNYVNFYLFGVSITTTNKEDFTKLLHYCTIYCKLNGIDIPKKVIESSKEDSPSNKKTK